MKKTIRVLVAVLTLLATAATAFADLADGLVVKYSFDSLGTGGQLADESVFVQRLGREPCRGLEEAYRDGEAVYRPLLPHIGGGEVHGHRELLLSLVSRVLERGRNAILGLLDRGVRKTHDREGAGRLRRVYLDFYRRGVNAVYGT